MYRTDTEDPQAKIDELERTLTQAYDERRRAAAAGEASLSLLRLRAKALQQDIEALEKKAGPAPKAPSRARKVLSSVCFAVAAASLGAAGSSLIHADSANHGEGSDGTVAVPLFGATPLSTVEQVAEPAPVATVEPAAEPEAAPATKQPEHFLTAADHEKLLARSRAFFRAAQKGDGAAMAKLGHPLHGISFAEEGLKLGPAELRECAQSSKLYDVTTSEESSVRERCRDIVARYGETDFARAPDVTFDTTPETPGFTMPSDIGTYVFFHFPGPKESELGWKGVALEFDFVGDEWALIGVTVANWTP